MANPPNDVYRLGFHGETVLTADRKPIVQGMRVYTNNLDRGTVDLTKAEYEWHSGENRYVLWFHVDVDTKYDGSSIDRRDMMSDDRVTTVFNGKPA